ncbi:MAG: SGNH/GDSL hydrolase family protein [Candidatus Omnitrophica bacterium]|nr:SGNH/GDSL hydrolase family protein [Candidatus Omnitrophota bacterium]
MEKNLLFKNGETIVFIGDSITDAWRRDQFFPYGNGYVKMAIDLLTARYPEKSFTYFNRGISGDTVEGLNVRWHDDLIILKPDWVSVMIGINDLRDLSNPISPDKYEKLYRAILRRTKQETKAKLILLEPFYISRDLQSGSYRSWVLKIIPDYIKVVRRLSGEFDALLIKTHDIFQKQLKYRPADTFCPEPIHPNATGHLIIAHELLKAINFQF